MRTVMNGSGSEFRQPLGYAIVGGADRVAGPDAIHHAGDLSLPRSVEQLAKAAKSYSGTICRRDVERPPLYLWPGTP
jgi:hypothetical protein